MDNEDSNNVQIHSPAKLSFAIYIFFQMSGKAGQKHGAK